MALRFTLRQLEYLVAVGEYGSVTEAAERVNVSAPSVSAAISQLEREFRINLFIRRHAQGLSLTPAGRSFVDHARAILAQAGELNSLSNALTGHVRGPLHVACLLTFAQSVIPMLRRGFCDAYPEVNFAQYERDHAEILDGLRHARYDLALSYDLEVPPDMDFHPLMTLPPYAVLHAGHALAQQDEVSLAQLAPLPYILLDLPLSADYFMGLFRAKSLYPDIVERTRDISVMRAMVANRFGYSIANIRPAAVGAVGGGRIVARPIAGQNRALTMGILTMRGAASALTVEKFIEFSSQSLAQMPEVEPA